MVGSGFTVTVVVEAVPAQPSAFVPVTVYTVVDVGVATGFAHAVQLRSPPGLHT
jgi:hypothetical protein